MQIFALNKPVRGIIFDIDMTLYDNKSYYNSQKQLLVEKLAEESNQSYSQTLEMVDKYSNTYSAAHGGQSPSLGHTLLHFGVDFQKNIDWRNELFKPEDYLFFDKDLFITMTILANKCRMVAVTNNTAEIGHRTLKVLEIDDFFLKIIGIEESRVSKPSMIPFEMAAKAMHRPYNQIVSIGDRFAVDIELPVKEGMGGILVESIEDVYRLPEILG